jgi:regulator of protease activity HflC (stomatin/prohibitin superfamily)
MDFLQSLGLELAGLGTGLVFGAVGWFVMRCVLTGFFTVDQSERAVKVRFGRAARLAGEPTTKRGPVSEGLARADEDRYVYPQLEVIQPGGPYFKWPWERVVKVSVSIQTLNMAHDPESTSANQGGTVLEAVTKDQLNTGLTGQLRYRVSEQNLYAYLFAVKNPIAHVMGYFISILRERIASFEAPPPPRVQEGTLQAVEATVVADVSINDLRKNLRDLNEHMDRECRGSLSRYGIVLDASLITGIDPPGEVESALAAINTAHNHVSSDISLAQAAADQKIVQSRRAVEIETLKAQAEVEPLNALAAQLTLLHQSGPGALEAYLRNIRLGLFSKASQVVLGVKP